VGRSEEEEIPGLVEGKFVGFIGQSFRCKASVTGVAFLASAHDCREPVGFEIQTTDAVITDFAEVECVVGSHSQTVGLIHRLVRACYNSEVLGKGRNRCQREHSDATCRHQARISLTTSPAKTVGRSLRPFRR